MVFPTPAEPGPQPPTTSAGTPLAVAVGNASLFGIGYLMLGRRGLAMAAGAVTVVLAAILAGVARSVWFELIVLAWWAAVIAHGWYLASRPGRPAEIRGQWVKALAVTVPVLLIIGLLRVDVSGIEASVADGRASGDCAQVLSAQHRVWFGDRIADSPLAARGDGNVAACGRLRTAEASLTTGLTGDTGALKSGFGTLTSLLADPGNEKMVEVALNEFLSSLPVKDPCRTATVTDWLRGRRPSHTVLDRSAEVVARIAPAALTACGDELMAATDWQSALSRYQQLLDQHPGDKDAARARAGVRRATLDIQLAHVRHLLAGSDGGPPAYCSAPAQYDGAAPYGHGTNRALFYGNTGYTSKLPSGWRAGDVAHAVLVVCVGGAHQGASVQSCPYTSEDSPNSSPTEVTFHKIAIPVKAYELRTGKLVFDRTIQISGRSCPSQFSYTSYLPSSPPSDENVNPSTADVRAAFGPVINH